MSNGLTFEILTVNSGIFFFSILKVILTTEEVIPATLKVISATTSCSNQLLSGQDHFVRGQVHPRGG